MENAKCVELSEMSLDMVNGGSPTWLKKALGCLPVVGSFIKTTMDVADGTEKVSSNWDAVEKGFDVSLDGLGDLFVWPYIYRCIKVVF